MPMVPGPETPPFDAVAAAKELDDSLAEPSAAGPRSDDYVTSLEADIEELTATVARKDEMLRRASERADQAHAEIEAATRRIETASAKELEQRIRKVLEGLLSVLDDLDRGIVAARKHAESEDVVAGLELVRRSMLTQLGQFGVMHAPALGEPFDPQRHEAITLVPVADAAQDGRVIAVMREGYLIGEDVLRPAGVAVGKRNA
jgi:molecular chaperone GrpE